MSMFVISSVIQRSKGSVGDEMEQADEGQVDDDQGGDGGETP